MLILGYAGYNLTLRQDHVMINRTCREATALDKGISYLEELFFKNLSDLLKTMQWNAEHDVKFYRISSDIAPHCTNPNLMNEKDKKDYTKLVYPLEKFGKHLKKIGKYAKDHNIRITFHPDIFNVLNSPDTNVVLKTYRDLHFHSTLLDLMGLDMNSVLVLHGGGVYGDKENSMKRWIENFNKLPSYIKQRIVLENDETGYNAEDVLKMAGSVDYKIPVVFDVFHYYCYNIWLLKRAALEEEEKIIETQKSIEELLPLIKKTWDISNRDMKMHISEQSKEDTLKGYIGAHSDFIDVIPTEIIDFAKDKTIYLMCECKGKELCLLHLRKKYPKITS